MISLGQRMAQFAKSLYDLRGLVIVTANWRPKSYLIEPVKWPPAIASARYGDRCRVAVGAPPLVTSAFLVVLVSGAAPSLAADNFAIDNATGTFTVIRCTDVAGVCTLNTILAAGSAVIGSTVPVAGTTGGATPYFIQPAASDNHAVIKNGAGTVYGIVATNNSVTTNYLRLYNLGTGFNGCNSATGLLTQVAILPSGGVSTSLGAAGMAFSTGLSICVTSGYATTDTTNATASAMSITVLYN